jgi:hypothetical protein
MAIADPNRAMLRSERVEPKCKKSRTDSDDPTLAKPNNDIDAPIRIKWRTESVDPRCRKSNTDIAEPSRP